MFDTNAAVPHPAPLDGPAAVCISPGCDTVHVWGSTPIHSQGWYDVSSLIGPCTVKLTHNHFPVTPVRCKTHENVPLKGAEREAFERPARSASGGIYEWARLAKPPSDEQMLASWVAGHAWVAVHLATDVPAWSFQELAIRRTTC